MHGHQITETPSFTILTFIKVVHAIRILVLAIFYWVVYSCDGLEMLFYPENRSAISTLSEGAWYLIPHRTIGLTFGQIERINSKGKADTHSVPGHPSIILTSWYQLAMLLPSSSTIVRLTKTYVAPYYNNRSHSFQICTLRFWVSNYLSLRACSQLSHGNELFDFRWLAHFPRQLCRSSFLFFTYGELAYNVYHDSGSTSAPMDYCHSFR